jgi:hypothetical protein
VIRLPWLEIAGEARDREALMDQESLEVAVWQALEDLEKMGKPVMTSYDVQDYLRGCGIELEITAIVAVMYEAVNGDEITVE